MMQSFVIPHDIVSEMNKTDNRHHNALTLCSLYTCIRAVLKQVNELNADVVLGVVIAIANMNTAPDARVVDFPLNKLPFLLPLSPTQSNLPQEIVLHRTGIPKENLYIRMNRRTQSRYFMEKFTQDLFRCFLFISRQFPQKILGTQI